MLDLYSYPLQVLEAHAEDDEDAAEEAPEGESAHDKSPNDQNAGAQSPPSTPLSNIFAVGHVEQDHRVKERMVEVAADEDHE